MKNQRYVSIPSILSSILKFIVQVHTLKQVRIPYYNEKASPFSPELVHRQTERVGLSEIERLMDLLGIKPGMTILDIGAGSGQYAYKFAERLNGTGKVFATDINTDMIKYLSEQVRARNLTNLSPVLVKGRGLDEFYIGNKFDLIFIAHAYYYLNDRINYFKRLKDSLSQNGRLVVLNDKDFQEFSSSDVSDFNGLIKQLSLEKFDSPFFFYLRESTRKLLHRPLEDKTKSLKKALITDLNSMRKDIYFLSNFLKDGLTFKEDLHFTTDESRYVHWALRFLKLEDRVLDETGVLDINNRNINSKHLSLIDKINTVLIVQRFRQYLYNGKPAPYLPYGYCDWQRDSIIQQLSLPGYSLKHKYDFIPFEIILVFAPNKNSE